MTTPSEGLRVCTRCGEGKLETEMSKANLSQCKRCDNLYAQAWRRAHPEHHKAYYSQWRAKNKAKLEAQRLTRLAKLSDEQRAEMRKRQTAIKLRGDARFKSEVYAAYGGYVCACCGETEKTFLSIDHVNNDGADHRRTHRAKSSSNFYRWLRKNGYPEGFQVLCMNCNVGKHRNNGVCPHQATRNDYPEREYGQVAGSAAPLSN